MYVNDYRIPNCYSSVIHTCIISKFFFQLLTKT